jgi:hypothetical protein
LVGRTVPGGRALDSATAAIRTADLAIAALRVVSAKPLKTLAGDTQPPRGTLSVLRALRHDRCADTVSALQIPSAAEASRVIVARLAQRRLTDTIEAFFQATAPVVIVAGLV